MRIAMLGVMATGLALAFASSAWANIVRVRTGAAGQATGESWTDAFPSLTAGLAAAGPGDQVWVARGTYPVPDNNGFIAPAGISMYGGFVGTESSITQRPSGSRTELTGFHPYRGIVVLVFNNAPAGSIVDGFKFDGTLQSQPQSGGGMIIEGGSPTIRNCHFFDNISGNSAGVRVSNANATFEDCFFENNWSQVGDGGGIGAIGTGSLTVRRCRFVGNFCRALYGQMGRGAGIFNGAGSVLRVSDCLFDDNWAYNLDPTIPARGGGIANLSSNAIIERCVFTRNEASGGGAIYCAAPTTIINCSIVGNKAAEPFSTSPFVTGEGGGIMGDDGIDLVVKSCTIAANWSKHTAAGVFMDGSLENCILWGNVSLVEPGDNPETTQDQQFKGSVDVIHCDVAGLLDSSAGQPQAAFPGSIQSNPMFLITPTVTSAGVFTPGDVHLRAGSPCVDTGLNSALPTGTTTDLEGLARIINDPASPGGAITDMGAHERQAAFCRADFNHSGTTTVQDIFDFLAAWFTGAPGADFNGAAGTTVQDIFDFLTAWFGPC